MSKIIQMKDGAENNLYPQNAFAEGAADHGNTTSGIRYRRYGRVVTLQVNVQLSSAMSSATEIATLPTGFRPHATTYVFSWLNYSGTMIGYSVAINSAGTITVTPIANGTLQNGGWLRFSMTWITNNAFPS